MQHSNGGRQPLILIRDNDGKVAFSRQLTKESSVANTSSRVFYYGSSGGSIPFRWESRPGTPKHPSYTSPSSLLVPPLTPPPSCYAKLSTPDLGGRTKPKVVRAIFSKLRLPPASPRRLLHMSPSSSVSSSLSSSSSMRSLSSPSKLRQRNNLSCSRFPLKFGLDDDEVMDGRQEEEEEEDDEPEEYLRRPSPTSTLSFGTRRSNTTGTGSRFRGCYPLFSIIGHQGNV